MPIARVVYIEPDIFRPRHDHVRSGAHLTVGILLVLAAVLTFSSSSSIVKWADTPGSVVAFWRMIGAIVLWWVVIGGRRVATGRRPPSGATWRAVLPAGLFFGFNIALIFTAITTRASPTPSSSPPSARCSSSRLARSSSASNRTRGPWRGVPCRSSAWPSCSFLGGSQGGASVGGDALVLVVVVHLGRYLLTSRRARATVDVVDFMTTVMSVGLLTAAPIALILDGDELWPLAAKGWVAVALLSVLTGMLAHGLIVAAQRDVDVGTIGILQVAQPALAVVWSYILLGEEIRPARGPRHGAGHRRPRRVHAGQLRRPATRPARVEADNTGSSLVRWAERVAAAADPRT